MTKQLTRIVEEADKRVVGERRIFARTPVEVDGSLHWATKRLIGAGTKPHEAEITTLDLSVDGAKVLLDKRHNLPPGASVRLMFGSESSPARVLEVIEARDGNQILRLNLERPDRSFMEVIEQWLDTNAGGKKFAESFWISDSASDGDVTAA